MDLDPDIASQMGFTSFGAQPTAKKRKYNPTADAVTNHTTILDIPGPRSGGGMVGGRGDGANGYRGGRGSNSTPLGSARRKQGTLGDRTDKEDQVGHGVIAGTGATQGDKTTCQALGSPSKVDEDGVPDYIDDTPPGSPLPSLKGEHTQLADVDKHRQSIFHPPGPKGHRKTRPMAEDDGAMTLAERGKGAASKMQGQRYDWAILRRGVRNQQGDMAYYDQSFVEDPWRELIVVRGNRHESSAECR